MKKVGLIGFFNRGAYSDDMISYATKVLLSEYDDNLEFHDNLMFHPKIQDVNFLNSFDLLVLCGGSLLGKCEFNPVNIIEKWYSKLTTPLCIFGTGYRYEPDKEPLSIIRRRRMELLFNIADIIMLRGKRSLHWCKMNDIDVSKVENVGEPMIGLRPRFTALKCAIGGNVRNMSEHEIQYNTNAEVQRKMADIYDYLIDEIGIDVHFYSFKHDSIVDNDIIGIENVRALMKNKNTKIIHYNTAVETFHNMNVLLWVGQRLHPSVYCAKEGIPFIGIDTQFQKTWDFMTSINCDNFITITDPEEFIYKYDMLNNGYIKYIDREVDKSRKMIRGVAKKIVEMM
jgi:polysaccharide pyruvyl transferase WcaK-like protein